MTEQTENLILEYMRQFGRQLSDFDRKLSDVSDDVRGLKLRMTAVEENLVGVQRRLDRLEDGVERIERRLELADAPH